MELIPLLILLIIVLFIAFFVLKGVWEVIKDMFFPQQSRTHENYNPHRRHTSSSVSRHVEKKDPYQLLLEDRRWKARREEILERDGHKCTWCGRTDHLQVHHKCYYRYPDGRMAEPWDYPDSKLVTLCETCHKKYHEKYHVGTYYRKRGEHYR